MKFISDFHVHSKFSRATAKDMDLENLYIAAQLKGITVVGTGDFTHPEWFSQLRERLVPADNGLYTLNPGIAEKCDETIPVSCRSPVFFILTAEISNIYKKKEDKTRKNHNLVFAPDLDSAARFNAKLSAIGNIKSDGRPILGLDARDLLEIVLETMEDGFFVPAHIWTPWFSLLGSRSGFDSIEECFEDLVSHIHAAETGLSSDPPMNWRVSCLDGITLISNSDAHSPANLGREANLFDTELSYGAIVGAMKTGDPEHFKGTIEFYPEEGKYHYDGHRKCDTRFAPERSIANKGVCPVCGKPLTLGVLYRVNALSDRREGEKPKRFHPYCNIVPMSDILSEILRSGPKTKRVLGQYRTVLEKLGPELEVLRALPFEKIEGAGVPFLAEAVRRARENRVDIEPGYDGEYGRVKLFGEGELDKLAAQKLLFDMPRKKTVDKPIETLPKMEIEEGSTAETTVPCIAKNVPNDSVGAVEGLNEEQGEAVESCSKVLLIVAGPGTGKTRTLVHRIAHLISERKIPPENILAATFTNKAAGEMKDRLEALLGGGVGRPAVGTFHALCLEILKGAFPDRQFSVLEENDRLYFVKEAVRKVKREYPDFSTKPSRLLKAIARAKQEIAGPDDDLEPYAQDIGAALFKQVYVHYKELLVQNRCLDFEDLLYEAVVLFESDPNFLSEIRNRFRFVFVDEYQDLNQAQYRIVRALAPSDLDQSDRGLFVIGDPDQSIYGFRGSDVRFFQRFLEDYPGARAVYLNRNYRCTETILKASRQVIEKQRIGTETPRIYSGIEGVPVLHVVETPSDKSEVETIARIVEKLVGGTGFYSIDSGRAQGGGAEIDRSFSDIAVLFRTRDQGRLLEDTFGSRGIPCQLVGKENLFGKEGAGELLSFLRVIHDAATYPDLERALLAMNPSIGWSDAKNILAWGVRNGFSVRELLEKIGKFPVPSVNEAQRRIALEFAEDLAKIRTEIDTLSEMLTVKMQLNHLAKQTALRALIFKTAANSDAFNKVLDFSAQFGKDVRNFLSSVALQTDPDAYFSRAEKVSLMTMHAAKGLEFPVVFVAGCEDGCIPFGMDNETGDPEEERRLFYVAMTRAKEELYLTWALNRTIRGKITNRNISPFVGEIERNLKRHERALEAKKAGSAQVQLRMF